MRVQKAGSVVIAICVLGAVMVAGSEGGKAVSVHGYVLDSACAFTKGLKKPISPECAQACAKAGSPLVILADGGTIYWPIADTTPSAGQNDKLMPFAGQTGYGQWQNLRAWRIDRDCDREDCGGSRAEISPQPPRLVTVPRGFAHAGRTNASVPT